MFCRFHYDIIKQKYPKAQLLFTDTDSLYYYIETWDLETELLRFEDMMDYSEYDEKSVFHDKKNKKVIGKFKCETKGAPIIEFVGLRPKMYSYLYKEKPELESSTLEKHRGKGITRSAARALTHEAYKSQLDCPTENYITNRRLGSKLHRIYAIEFEKRGLCAFDDKRFLLEDGINSLAYGHKSITNSITRVECNNPGGDLLLTNREARSKGLIWSRRKFANNHLELNDRPPTDDAAEQEKTNKLKRKIKELNEASAKKYKPATNETKEVESLEGEDDDISFSDSDLDISPK